MLKLKYRDFISISIEDTIVEGELLIPFNSKSLVILPHGNGNSRFRLCNNIIAKELHAQGISTFQFDLLTKEEGQTEANQLNVDLLSERLIFTTYYISLHDECSDLRIGYLAMGTDATATIHAAAALPDLVNAIVLCGSKLHLAINLADRVKAPTLLIVGEKDIELLDLNKKFYKSLNCEKLIDVLPNASNLFKEPGTLIEAAKLTTDWFNIFLQHKKEKLIA